MATYDPSKPPVSLQDALLTLDPDILLALIPPTTLAARGMRTFIDGYTTEEGGYDPTTLALIAGAQSAGWPTSSIIINVLGLAPVSSTVAVPQFSALATFATPTVSATAIYDTVTVTLNPAPGAVIVYTLDGSDPMDYIVTDNGIALFDNGELLTTGDVR